jgi:pimeloyl-ACP methyl ester carboxylesterase
MKLPYRSALTVCLTVAPILVAAGCSAPAAGEDGAATSELTSDPSHNDANRDAITYLSLDKHPGCTTLGLETRSVGCPSLGSVGGDSYAGEDIVTLPGYRCAAKTFTGHTGPEGKPILLLVHGDSDTPDAWEKRGDGPTMLAERAEAAGFHVLAVDLRFDKVPQEGSDLETGNTSQTFDHGWAVPVVQHFFDSVMTAYPHQPISIVGFSVGSTVARDALRRLHRANRHPFERIKDVVLAAGMNHGSSLPERLCQENPTMRGKLVCQLGERTGFVQTPFLASLNGRDGAFETPCADGDSAFGQRHVCGGHRVRWTTVTMKDRADGGFDDELTSEASAKLKGAQNLVVAQPDSSGYFCNGLFRSHYGAIRSDAGLETILEALTAH